MTLAGRIADELRERIRSGALPHGARLPFEQDLAAERGVGRETVTRAYAILRNEGLIETRAPYGSRVRRPQRRRISVPRGSTMARVWMPSPREREQYGVPEGVPLMEIVTPAGVSQVHRADEVTFTVA